MAYIPPASESKSDAAAEASGYHWPEYCRRVAGIPSPVLRVRLAGDTGSGRARIHRLGRVPCRYYRAAAVADSGELYTSVVHSPKMYQVIDVTVCLWIAKFRTSSAPNHVLRRGWGEFGTSSSRVICENNL